MNFRTSQAIFYFQNKLSNESPVALLYIREEVIVDEQAICNGNQSQSA